MAPRVLVVEDEPLLRHLIGQTFLDEGFEVATAGGVAACLSEFRQAEPDLILLDIVLPDGNGLNLCGQIRAISQVPIIILTGLEAEVDIVRGLRAGADDYITKPFRPRELLARAEANIRRRSQDRQASPPARLALDDGRFVLDFDTRSVWVDEREALLTPREFAILSYLALNAGRVVPHDELVQHVWGSNKPPRLVELRTYVKLIRRKIEPAPPKPRYLQSRAGTGYLVPKLGS